LPVILPVSLPVGNRAEFAGKSGEGTQASEDELGSEAIADHPSRLGGLVKMLAKSVIALRMI
jgi:hypothetical protein